MGIEPDRRTLTRTSNGFEDRASHQTRCASAIESGLFITQVVIGQPYRLFYAKLCYIAARKFQQEALHTT